MELRFRRHLPMRLKPTRTFKRLNPQVATVSELAEGDALRDIGPRLSFVAQGPDLQVSEDHDDTVRSAREPHCFLFGARNVIHPCRCLFEAHLELIIGKLRFLIRGELWSSLHLSLGLPGPRSRVAWHRKPLGRCFSLFRRPLALRPRCPSSGARNARVTQARRSTPPVRPPAVLVELLLTRTPHPLARALSASPLVVVRP